MNKLKPHQVVNAIKESSKRLENAGFSLLQIGRIQTCALNAIRGNEDDKNRAILRAYNQAYEKSDYMSVERVVRSFERSSVDLGPDILKGSFQDWHNQSKNALISLPRDRQSE